MLRSLFLVAASAVCLPSLFGQNLNVTYRAKMTFPGASMANLWAYAAEGREYGLLGGQKGMVIVDVTEPDSPRQIVLIPGPTNLWKEIKTYSHYAYVVSEGGQGVQIIDLQNLPSDSLAYYSFYGDSLSGNLTKAHALHIDLAKGFLYLYGSNLASGGPVVFDLKPDPYHPVFAGSFSNLGYVHDGYVDNDTLYAGYIYAGNFTMINMADKSAPQVLAAQPTPGAFTHNTWLAEDRRTLLSTDEVSNSFLTAYDVSDPNDIRYLDKIQSNPGSNSIVHNTHVRGNWAITSWYKDGFTLVDITRPENLVQVGNYDTYPLSGSGFEGCWGVCPYLPSGTILATTIKAQGTQNGELWVLTPNYQRACYLEGKITDAITTNPLNGATIQILNTPNTETSAPNGDYKMGQEQPGGVTVRVSKAGYQSQDLFAPLKRGEVTTLDVALYPEGELTLSGQVVLATDQSPVAGAVVSIIGAHQTWPSISDASGQFSVSGLPPGNYTIMASKILVGSASLQQSLTTTNQSVVLPLKKGRG